MGRAESKKPKRADKLIGEAVRFRRQELGLTQSDVAKAIGVTFQQVQRYEIGETRIPAGRLAAIADILQVPISYFFSAGARSMPRLLKVRGASDLLRYYAKLESADVRKSILQLTHALGPDASRSPARHGQLRLRRGAR